LQVAQCFGQLLGIGHFDHHGGRAEHFFLQQRVAIEQQAHRP
jgi:hypothetical protein